MSADPPPSPASTATTPTAPRWHGLAAAWRARLGATHPTRRLRWLRTGVLATVALTALLNLLVSYQADRQIAAIRHTDRSIGYITKAAEAAKDAGRELDQAFKTGQVGLIGVGTDFDNSTASVMISVTSAAEGNAAGPRGLALIQFVQGQLTTCIQRANVAVEDYSRALSDSDQTSAVSPADFTRPVQDALQAKRQKDYQGRDVPGTGGLVSSLEDLAGLQEDARRRQLHSIWLNDAVTWTLRLGAAAVMVTLVAATGLLVARHFRRFLDGRFWVALLITAVVVGAGGVLGTRDAAELPEEPWSGHPLAPLGTLLLLAVAGFLAYRGYRDRLNEYRFRRR